MEEWWRPEKLTGERQEKHFKANREDKEDEEDLNSM